jgi:arylsulfatase
VNDIVPTIYEVVGIQPPDVVNGYPQDPIHGVSLAYTFDDPDAEGRLHTQYFEIMGSRGIYHDGWFAAAFGPRAPWTPGLPAGFFDEQGHLAWSPDQDRWELFDLEADWSQANDLADEMPEKLAAMKEIFIMEFAKNQGFPIGGGLWVPVVRPDLRLGSPYTEWTFSGDITRLPEFAGPALGNRESLVTIDLDVPPEANGVLYALGGFSAGLSLYVRDGILAYEYNLFEIQRTHIEAQAPLRAGRAEIEVLTRYAEKRPAGPLEVTLRVDGAEVAKGVVPVSAPLGFTANDCFDVGTDLGSPVSIDYFDEAPFAFDGEIRQVRVQYTDVPSAQHQ